MKRVTRRSLRAVLAMSVVAAMLLSGTLTASAYGPGPLLGWSASNPNQSPKAWREGWGASTAADLNLNVPAGAEGFYWVVDRTPASVIDTATFAGCEPVPFDTPVPWETLYTKIVDLQAVYANEPVGGWGYSVPGMTQPVEGIWFFHYVFFQTDPGTGSPVYLPQRDFDLALDVTPPAAVSGVAVTADAAVPPAATAIGPGDTAIVSWDGTEYDGLSGTSLFTLYVDDVAVMSGGPDDANHVAPWVYDPAAVLPYSATIGSLAPGKHELRMTATDRGGNEGPKSAAATFISDPDTPTVTLIAPVAAGRLVPAYAAGSDLAGVKSVELLVDGQVVASAAGATCEKLIDIAPWGVGTHTISARVTDLMGRVAVSSQSVNIVDITFPTISRVKDTPDPFFPFKRDRYKDDLYIKFRLAERAYVLVGIYDASGNLIRVLAGWKNKGNQQFKWNGRDAAGYITPGTYHYVLISADGKYNGYINGFYPTRIKTFILKRLSRSRVKVVFH